ncbi:MULTISPECIES: alanine--tRNA ligase [unclassified Carboxydocella]|uniref:alanine--tRNA ligase n=1 Tax=unclassified Carboxydocella TaxID=2685367 RepID=UPI0009AD3458|nr:MULTISPECIES: alanine--tRNA ligase [unclassified Carboxydocella]GAW27827.1 alanine--tRNA ligase [Carboxydocella sp. ULO1]GAW30264.1 alanine--tRNA ligase [Carboxydocella sp. JDF658]
MLTGNQIREKFLSYFERQGHARIASSSLVPHNDPTLLFTNAGMNQFKDVFLGLEQRPYRRATTAQKCVRAGGKHNDLDTVGRTARHHTFFEMLGNFSFGDYFKRDAIRFAWEFLTEELGLPKERLYATIYLDDEEAFQLWQEIAGLPPEKIIRLGEKDNFWAMGDTGPCGPCSEILIDRGEEFRCDAPECFIGKCDCDRWLEIWNLVFMQYNRDADGTMTPLPRPSIDTGMGLERITSVIQNVSSNYETDLLLPYIKAVEEMCGQPYQRDERGFPFRVIADHARSCTFLVGDGVLPSNEGRGYVLRRILRRAVRFGKILGINRPFLYELVAVVAREMGDAYPEVREKADYIARVIKLEEERFHVTLNEGMALVEQMIAEIKAAGGREISGQQAFLLYDTYGFPLDLTEDAAAEHGLTVDKEGFARAMAEQRERARAARGEGAYLTRVQELWAELGNKMGATPFLGYQHLEATANVVALIVEEQQVETVASGQEVQIVLNETPFYAESGGQVGDRGWITAPDLKVRVTDTRKSVNGLIVHIGEVEEGVIREGMLVEARVDRESRLATARNHSATHLLHKALKQVLGDHVNQAGSLVAPDRLRFDFNHLQAVTAGELRRIEDEVNAQILAALPISTEECSLAEARERGATALFGEKYGDVVRMVAMGDYSLELCGGTHLTNTAQIGLFKIISESGIGAGLRRIEAVTGTGVLALVRQQEEELEQLAAVLKTQPAELVRRAEQVQAQIKELEKEVEQLKQQLAVREVADLLNQVSKVRDVKVLAARVAVPDAESLRNLGDLLKDKLGSGVVVLAATSQERVNFVAMVTRDLLGRGLHAGNIIREVARAAGGGGGGRPDMAQAGGKDPARTDAALQLVYSLVEQQLSQQLV